MPGGYDGLLSCSKQVIWDGLKSFGEHRIHCFYMAGTYTVTVKAENSASMVTATTSVMNIEPKTYIFMLLAMRSDEKT